MKKTAKVLVSLAAAIAAIAGALCLLGVFWDKLVALCPCSEMKSKLPSKDELIQKMPWRRSESEHEFADYDDC